LTLFLCVSCGQNSVQKDPTTIPTSSRSDLTQTKAIDNALTFINDYVDFCNNMTPSISTLDWISANTLTTPNFKSRLKTVIEDANKLDPEMGLGADPIFDAQDYPDKGFEFDSIDSLNNLITLKGIDWPDFKLTIKMARQNFVWLVDGCGMINMPTNK
jgi:hypothetical protein